MTRYLTTEDAARLIVNRGYVIRDLGLLASAIERPRQSAFGEAAYKSLWLKAAALCQSIDHYQSLIDGNKRMAWSLTKVLLLINGQYLGAAAWDAEQFILGIVTGDRPLEEVAEWLSQHCHEVEPPGSDQDFLTE